ncbi:MAG: hydrolase [Oceanococcus sp.]|nr:MAG: hydrolase [Oceanococcus sp.]
MNATPMLNWIAGRHDEMLARTMRLAEINSGSFHVEGVNRVGQQLAEWIAPLADTLELVEVPAFAAIDDHGDAMQRPLGRALIASKRADAPVQVVLSGHLDTVFAKDHAFQSLSWLDEHHLNGPGVTDLKGGLMVMLTALQALEMSAQRARLGWQLVLNPDEEIGSQSSMALFERAAKRAQYGLLYEPCMADGTLAGARKGSGNFTVVARGRAAHAGREHHLGRNAIRALADAISAIDQLNGQRCGVTFNPGFIHGGGAVNVVPDTAVARFNVRMQQPQDCAWCEQQIEAALRPIRQRDGIALELHGGFTRPPKPMTAPLERLFELARTCAEQIDLDLNWAPTGGCCDGNNLAALGVPNIDTLGVQGGKIHSVDEYLDVRSLVPRAQLSALLLERLAEA